MFQKYFKESFFFRTLFFPKNENQIFKSKILEAVLGFLKPLVLKTERFFKESASYKLINRFYG